MSDAAVRQGGFTYIFVLLALTVLALGLLKSQELESLRYREQREDELLFRGEQIRQAIAAWQQSGNGCYPIDFNDLLQDKRGEKPLYHLRQHYPDPLTGKEWGRVVDPQGRWIGVYSKGSGKPLRKTGFSGEQAEKFRQAKSYHEWEFAVKVNATAPLPAACNRQAR